jgi:hypothetical protein
MISPFNKEEHMSKQIQGPLFDQYLSFRACSNAILFTGMSFLFTPAVTIGTLGLMVGLVGAVTYATAPIFSRFPSLFFSDSPEAYKRRALLHHPVSYLLGSFLSLKMIGMVAIGTIVGVVAIPTILIAGFSAISVSMVSSHKYWSLSVSS